MGIRQVPPSIKDPNLAGFLRELRAAIGGVSDQVTKLVQTRSSSSGGGTGPVDPGPVDPGPGGGGGDGYPPPAPTSLQAIPAAFSVTLVWTNPVIPDLQATEVWARRSFDAWNSTYEYLANAKVLVNGTVYRSKRAQYVNPTNNVVTLNKNFPPATSPDWWEATTLAPTDKSKVGESAGNSWIHDALTPGETWAYWVRNRDIENLFSTYYPDDDVGVITTTLLDPGAYLELLTNSITATQLYRDLGTRINLIDGPLTIAPSCSIAGHTSQSACEAAGGTWNPGSVAYRVAEEAAARADGLAAEALARETGITNEATVRQTQDEQLASTISIVNAKADSAAAAVVSEQTARVNADGALGQRIDSVVATAAGNTAAITSESTARANADGALSTRIDSVVATTNNNTAAIQTETSARTTADSALSSRIDTVVAKAENNAAAISSEATTRANADGALGQRIDQVQAVSNNNSALITDLEQAKIGYCSIGAHTTKATCEDNGGTWYSQPLATAVKQVSVSVPAACFINGTKSGYSSQAACEAAGGSWISASTAAIEQQFLAQQEINGDLYNQYTVKIDQNGWVSGFGLASKMQSDGSVISDFGIRADRFWLAPPNTPLTAKGGPGTKLVDLGSGAVIRVTTIYGILGGVNGAFDIAYLQVDNLNGQSIKSLTGLDNYNPFTTNINPNARRWVSMRNVRSSLGGGLLDAWNQAFVPVAVGNFSWQDYRYGNVWTYASSLPGVTDGNRVIVLGVAPSTLPTYQWGYSIPATDTTNDPAKIVAENLLPFIVTTTPKKYNGVDIPAGVFINNAFIASAMLGKAVMTGVIGSDNYVAGASGWQIDYNGNAEFNTVIVRSGANVGNNAIVKANTVSNHGAMFQTKNGFDTAYLTDEYYNTYIPKTPAGKTAGFFFGLDLDAATSYTTKVEVIFSGAFSHTWTAYSKGNSVIGARYFSGATTHNPTVNGSNLTIAVRVTNNGAGGSWGDVKLSILEITG